MSQEPKLNPSKSFQSDFKKADESSPLQSSKSFDGSAYGEGLIQSPHEEELQSRRISKGKTGIVKWLVIGLITWLVAELGISGYTAWQASPYLGGVFAGIIGLILGCGIILVVREIRELKHLKAVSIRRSHVQSHGISSKEIVKLLAQEPLLNHYQKQKNAWRQSIMDHHNAGEVSALFERHVLSQIDKDAKVLIEKTAMQTGLMVAVSPFALMDMIIVLWRGLWLIGEVSSLYGMTLGYWARIRVLKSLMKQMLLVGTTELVTDMGSTLLSSEIAAKLSLKASQGIVSSVFMARMGFKVINEVRPIQALEAKSSITKLTTSLLKKLG
ncbi:TIGR01620 family protein [Algicola sagamiensis]|uniref:TIGR01620 family protein n=1 Tax=Algicola sagamiensis TaxID=163869 RepID=UPI0003667C2F|nr:TIGR01620 family protein [Algicola sagamiensis]